MSVRAGLVGVAVGSAVVLAACTSDSPGSTGSPGTGRPATSTATAAPLRWERVTLPDSLAPVTLATLGDEVVVGAFGSSRPLPHLLVGADAASLREVPLTPGSPYAFEARWFQVATSGDRIDAIAGARGGAHGNYRWSTWTGDSRGVAEQEQPFGVFGSYGAGDLAGIAYAGISPVVLGAWQSEQTGMDVATWNRTGNRWARVPSTGTALGSTPQELLDARVVTTRGDGLLLGGSVTHLAPGSVAVTPAAWVSPGPSGPWTRVDLPRRGDSGTSEVDGARCSTDRCLLTGVTDGLLSLWQVEGANASELDGIPEVELPEKGAALSPVVLDGDDVVVASADSGTTVLRRHGSSWTTLRGPSGTPTSVVAHGDELWVVTADPRGSTTLWRARVA